MVDKSPFPLNTGCCFGNTMDNTTTPTTITTSTTPTPTPTTPSTPTTPATILTNFSSEFKQNFKKSRQKKNVFTASLDFNCHLSKTSRCHYRAFGRHLRVQ
jgi:hypothetical protein